MNRVRGKYYLVDTNGNILRFGVNGVGCYSYCVYSGNVVLFDSREEAISVWQRFTNVDEWHIEEI